MFRYDCYYAAVDAFHEKCFNVGRNDFALRMLNVFVNLCEKGVSEKTMIESMEATCTHPPIYGIH